MTDGNITNDKSFGSPKWVVTRRVFLRSAAAAVAGLCLPAGSALAEAAAEGKMLRFGILSDSHYADIETNGSRYYREALSRMSEAVSLMNDEDVDFVIELGDLKNGAHSGNLEHLRAIETVYAGFKGPRYHVLGNHDLDQLSKVEFQAAIENTGIPEESTYYSFDHRGVHIIVLDANYRADGVDYHAGNFTWTDANIPRAQLAWLKEDLENTKLPSIVCVHQPLDADEGSHFVRNAAAVRAILEQHPHVLAVFHGHQHAGDYSQINTIHYYTLRAMVEGSGEENNSYAIVTLHEDLTLEITGYRRAVSRKLKQNT